MIHRVLHCSLATLLTVSLFSMESRGQELLVRYTFDEESGVALDSGSSPAANGTLGPDATRTTDTPGGASPFALDLSAPGAGSFVNAGDPLKVDALESFTLTTWLKLEGLNADQDGSGNVRLIAKQAPDPFSGFTWNLNRPNDGERGPDDFRTGLFIGGEDGFFFSFSDEDVYADQWAFLAVTYDGLEPLQNTIFYFGDEETETIQLGDPEEPLTIAAGPVSPTEGIADFGIGITDAAPGIDFAAVGFQDDVRVYNGVLSLEELEAIRLENLTPPDPVGCLDTTNGDINGDGMVEFADFLVLSANFGRDDNVLHTDGDIDCDGTVAFADFLILSTNFGTAVGAESVPEPDCGCLLALGCLMLLSHRRRAR